MDEVRPGYYAVIPADVRYDDRIPANAKLLYGEISALIGADGYCFASNQYFSGLYGMAEETIARLITKLEKAGHIIRVLERDNNGQIVNRKLFLRVSVPDAHPLDEKINTSQQKNQEGIDEKVKDTNLSITNKKKVRKEKAPEPLTDEQLRDVVVAAITRIADPSWPKDVKNELFMWVMEMYNPNRVVKKAHPVRSQASVDAMFRKLSKYGGSNPEIMVCMLCSAVEAGWQGVQPPGGSQNAAPKRNPPVQRRDEEWL